MRSTPVWAGRGSRRGIDGGDSLAGMNTPPNTLSLQSWGILGVIRHTESFVVSREEWISFHRRGVR